MSFIAKRGRGLDPATLAWIMSTLQLGPGLGDIHLVAKPTSAYYSWLTDDLKVPASMLHTTVTDAYEAATASRNDVICVYPGAYDEGSSIDWTKHHTHLIGLGGPNNRADYSENNVVVYTDTAAVDYTVHLTGRHCQFHNIGINNAGANAGNYGPLYVDGYNNFFKNVGLIGNLTSQQLADNDCASLHIGTNAHNCKWINCDIGEDCWGAKTSGAQVSFIGSNPNGGLFKSCFFRIQTTTAAVAMITVEKGAAGTTHIGRGWVFDDCVFSNWGGDSHTTVNEVFDLDSASGHQTTKQLLIRNCSAIGFDEWTDNDAHVLVYGTMAESVDGGGLVKQLTDTVA